MAREEREQFEYTCMCAGHTSGDTTFLGAPEEWFEERGLSTPKRCPDCKAWINDQYDEVIRCYTCGFPMRISRLYKISQHRHEGPWEPPEQCMSCERGEKVARRTAAKEYNFDTSSISDLPDRGCSEVTLETNLAAYGQLKPTGAAETHEAHALRHVPGSPHHDPDRSPTSLVPPGATFPELLAAVEHIARCTDPALVREYTIPRKQGDRIVKIYPSTLPGKLEMTIIESSTNGSMLVTTYDNQTPRDIHIKLGIVGSSPQWR